MKQVLLVVVIIGQNGQWEKEIGEIVRTKFQAASALSFARQMRLERRDCPD
jgi:hypothetical protein